MNRRLLALTAVVFLAASSVFAAPPARHEALTLPISGSFTDAVGGRGSFTGTFQLVQFVASADNQLLATGYVSGTLTDSTGMALGSVMKAVSIPASVTGGGAAAVHRTNTFSVGTNATCDVLNLVLGPLHLDLLGLTVDLNQVVLDIAANTGSGNLLGNLLCGVVSLLDGVGNLVDIAQLLNQILSLLSGLLA